MAAKNVSKAVSMAVKPFEDIGKQVGSLASSIPKYTPIPGLGMSANSMGKVVTNAENAMIGASDKKFKASAAGKLFGWERVVATVDEKKLAEAMNAVGSNANDKANLKIVWEQIERQTGKDIEYSAIPKSVAEGLKKITSPYDKQVALENMWYNKDNAKTIVEQLAKHSGDFDKNDTTLMNAFKSRIGTPAGGAPWSSGTGFATAKVWETGNIQVQFPNDLRVTVDWKTGSGITEEQVTKLKELAKTLTEKEFKGKFALGTDDNMIQGIIKKIWPTEFKTEEKKK